MKIILDTETTGLLNPDVTDPKLQPRPIEIGLILTNDQFVPTYEKSWLINPGFKLPEEIPAISGITDEMLKNQPPFEAVYPELCEVVLGSKTMVAHNLHFDKYILKYALERMGKDHAFPWPYEQVCTVDSTLHIKGYRLSMEKLWKYLFGEENKTVHRALPDCRNLLRICQELQERGIIN